MQHPGKSNGSLISWGILVLVFTASLLFQVPVLFPSARPHLESLNPGGFYASLLLYSSPFLCLVFFAVSKAKHVKCRPIDLVYGGTVLLNAVSFFSTNGSSQPSDPVVLSTGAFFIYLFIRSLPGTWLKDNILLLLAIPVVPAVGEACHAFLQGLHGQSPVTASFYNYNFLGMFLAMSVPLAFSQTLTGSRGKVFRFASVTLTLSLALAVIMTTSRTAGCGLIIALAIALAFRYAPFFRAAWLRMSIFLKTGIMAGAATLSCCLIYLVYSIRPLSVWGRLLLIKIGLFIFAQNPFFGIGFERIQVELAKYQGEYFRLFDGSELERFLAGTPGAVTSVYLKTAVELGILGLILYIPFWFLVLRTGLKLVSDSRPGNEYSGQVTRAKNPLLKLGKTLFKGEKNGMLGFGAGSVLILFLIISIPYSPVRVPPVFIYFNYILGIAVSLLENSPGITGIEDRKG